MQPKTTIWDLEPHTAAKHEILRRYLQAWVPILSHGKFPRIVFIDCFAGPGRYSKGEEGSPLIAIKAVTEQRQSISAAVDFHFIELDADRATHLGREISLMRLPANVTPVVHAQRTFQSAFPDVWDAYAAAGAGRPRPPTFVFVDPFGFSVPFRLIAQILKAPNCEVLITFMYEEINRFLSQKQQPDNFDELFGCSEWRNCYFIKQPKDRLAFLHDLYKTQLEKAGARFVRSFTMRNDRNAADYMLFFGTSSELGLKKMKEAMWRIDEGGAYSFSDATDPNQPLLFSAEPDRARLTRLIVERFGGTNTTVGGVEAFVVQETPFRETHFRKVLQMLEGEGRLMAIEAPSARRRGTYADPNLKLRFSLALPI